MSDGANLSPIVRRLTLAAAVTGIAALFVFAILDLVARHHGNIFRQPEIGRIYPVTIQAGRHGPNITIYVSALLFWSTTITTYVLAVSWAFVYVVATSSVTARLVANLRLPQEPASNEDQRYRAAWRDLASRDLHVTAALLYGLAGLGVMIFTISHLANNRTTALGALVYAAIWGSVIYWLNSYAYSFECPRCRNRYSRPRSNGGRYCVSCGLPRNSLPGSAVSKEFTRGW